MSNGKYPEYSTDVVVLLIKLINVILIRFFLSILDGVQPCKDKYDEVVEEVFYSVQKGDEWD